MLIYDDKLFAEIEMYVYFNGMKYETANTVLYDYTLNRVGFENEWYYRVISVNEVLDKAFDWRMNRGDFENDSIDILDKSHWWFYRSYKTIERLKEAFGCK